MDAKITKLRLSRMLSYDWIKIIGVAAAFIFVWVLVFTMTATRILPSQQFTICNYMGNTTADGLTESVSKAKAKGAFSHEVIEVNSCDLTIAAENAYQLLQARTSTNELDAMMISLQGDPNNGYVDQETGKTKYLTYLDTFVYGYRYILERFDGDSGFIASMESYLDGYYFGDYETNELDTAKVENDFRARAKGDKRYKKEKEIVAGIEGEKERFEKYADALNTYKKYLALGYIEVTTVYEFDATQSKYSDKALGGYAINLAPATAPQAWRTALSRFTGYYRTDESGKTTVVADDMQICLFNSNESEHYRYEGMTYIGYVLDLLAQAVEA